LADVQLVSYRKREEGVWFLPDVADHLIRERYILTVLWGADVTTHIREYRGELPLLYYHRGIDFGVRLPPEVPILCTSKYLMTHSQEKWPANPQFYLPIPLDPGCVDHGRDRDIDVLIVSRKQPPYVLETLRSRLERRCKVVVLDDFVNREVLFEYFNRSKVYLYSFAPQRSRASASGWRMMEGFGFQPLEAQVCGCSVFSNLRGGMADFVEPWMGSYRLESHSTDWDEYQILRAVAEHPDPLLLERQRVLAYEYGEEEFMRRASRLLVFLDAYIPFSQTRAARPSDFGFPKPIGPVALWIEGGIGLLYRLKNRILSRKIAPPGEVGGGTPP
jgi:hypothetical protein